MNVFDEGMTALQICIFNFIECCRCIRSCLGFDIQYYLSYFNTNTYSMLYVYMDTEVCAACFIRSSLPFYVFVCFFFGFIGIHSSEHLMKCREAEIIKNYPKIVQITINFTKCRCNSLICHKVALVRIE